MTNLKLKIILGSIRQGRFGDKPARWIYEEAKKLEGVDAELIDLKEQHLPFFDEPVSPAMGDGTHANPAVAAWAAKIKEADAIIIVTPEYNHGYPGALKNAMDHLFQEWNNKPVAFVAYGGVGGARAVEQLKQVCVELMMVPIRSAIHLPWSIIEAFSKQTGEPDLAPLASFNPNAEKMLKQLIAMATAMKTLRS